VERDFRGKPLQRIARVTSNRVYRVLDAAPSSTQRESGEKVSVLILTSISLHTCSTSIKAMPKPLSDLSLSFPSTDDGIDPDELREELEWRMGFMGGYCAETMEPHFPEDFVDEEGGLISSVVRLVKDVKCDDCGLSITLEDYHRLKELSVLKHDLENSARKLEIKLKKTGAENDV